jgi:DNA-binding FrmR family transcriptional regulator
LTNTPHRYIVIIPEWGILLKKGRILLITEETNLDLSAEELEAQAEKATQCCHGPRMKHRSKEEVRSLINRLSRIEGQVRGIKAMVEKDAYCPDILVQSAAVSAAMNSFNKELLASHIRSCVAEDIRSGHDESIDELVRLLQKLMK